MNLSYKYVNNHLCTVDLDTRVVDLEENGGSDGNSSVAELEVRVETLEGTAANHETRISTTETDIEGGISFKKIPMYTDKICIKIK